jgi:hypothetical protein
MASSVTRELLNELYLHDPALREREAELIPLIEKLMKGKPNAPKDPAFFTKLRNEILNKTAMPSASKQQNVSLSLFRQFALVAAGGALALIVALPLTHQFSQSYSSLNTSLSKTSLSFHDAGARAFGTLTAGSGAEGLGMSPATLSSRSSGMGGGGTSAATEPAMDGKMMVPSTMYSYVYKGDISVEGIKDTVYRKSGQLSVNAGSLATATVGPVNIGAFSGSRLQGFNLTQGENGYSLYVGEDGSVSVNANQGIWNTLYANQAPLTASEVPSDADVISAADAFLQKYGIKKDDYGSPVVDQRSMMYVDLAVARGETPYYPDSMNVIYPLMVDGQPVMDQSGYPTGLSVNVHSRTKTVTGVYAQSYNQIDRSSYELESNTDAIREVLKKGGLYGYTDPEVKTEELEVGAPEVILMSYSMYDGTTSSNLFVPALKFKVLNPPKEGYYQDSIVVPLPKDILSTQSSPLYRTLEDGPAIEKMAQ